MASSSRRAETAPSFENGDPLYLHGSDHSSLVLVTTSLTETDYNAWSRAMKLALISRVKLGFIDGSCPEPAVASEEFKQWNRVNALVVTWIMNSISPALSNAFMYATNAADLWEDIKARYGSCNAPQVYRLQREIASISQGNLSVCQYFTKLKMLWDELACLRPMPVANGELGKELLTFDAENKLNQFLMGLNEIFESVRSQILNMDPLPSVTRAYTMVVNVEQQKAVCTIFADTTESSALLVKTGTERTQVTSLTAVALKEKNFFFLRKKEEERKKKKKKRIWVVQLFWWGPQYKKKREEEIGLNVFGGLAIFFFLVLYYYNSRS